MCTLSTDLMDSGMEFQISSLPASDNDFDMINCVAVVRNY